MRLRKWAKAEQYKGIEMERHKLIQQLSYRGVKLIGR